METDQRGTCCADWPYQHRGRDRTDNRASVVFTIGSALLAFVLRCSSAGGDPVLRPLAGASTFNVCRCSPLVMLPVLAATTVDQYLRYPPSSRMALPSP
jgi:hypothetical protein